MMSWSSTTKSAYFPGVSDPLTSSMNDAKAGHIDSWVEADGSIRAEWTYAPSTDPSTSEVPS